MIVVDASVALKWVVPEVESDLSERLFEREDLVAPDLLLVEAANALRRKISDGKMTLEVAQAGLAFIAQTIDVRPISSPLAARALEMGAAMGHPTYDCTYLAMAEFGSGQVVTYDAEFLVRAKRAGWSDLITTLSP